MDGNSGDAAPSDPIINKIKKIKVRKFRVSEDKPIYRTHFDIVKQLGEGSYGDVEKVKDKKDGKLYAVKRVPIEQKRISKTLREVKIMAILKHKHVVRYYSAWVEPADDSERSGSTSASSSNTDSQEDEYELNASPASDDVKNVDSSNSSADDQDVKNVDSSNSSADDQDDKKYVASCRQVSSNVKFPRYNLYIQMECCEFTLREAIDKGLPRYPKKIRRYFRQLLEGLEYIHSEGIIHRDLNTLNILIDSKDQIKIVDFGRADFSYAIAYKVLGIPEYLAPELKSAEKDDLYSLGVILFKMTYPMKTKTEMEKEKIFKQLQHWDVKLLKYYAGMPDGIVWVCFLRQLLSSDPNNRPQAKILRQLLSDDPEALQTKILCQLLSDFPEALLVTIFRKLL